MKEPPTCQSINRQKNIATNVNDEDILPWSCLIPIVTAFRYPGVLALLKGRYHCVTICPKKRLRTSWVFGFSDLNITQTRHPAHNCINA